MKLITESAIQKLEDKFDCLVINERYDLTLNLMWLTEVQLKAGEVLLKNEGIVYSKLSANRTVAVKQSNLIGKVDMSEERVWLSAKGQKATPTSEMDQQRLSNCIGLMEIYLKADRLTKSQGEDYLTHLTESIIPELNERYKGELLPYTPHFPWEKDLLKEIQAKEKSEKVKSSKV